jgi:hypothetical protein
LKIKRHWILSTEYSCIEITYLDFLPLNLTFSALFFNVKQFKISCHRVTRSDTIHIWGWQIKSRLLSGTVAQ